MEVMIMKIALRDIVQQSTLIFIYLAPATEYSYIIGYHIIITLILI